MQLAAGKKYRQPIVELKYLGKYIAKGGQKKWGLRAPIQILLEFSLSFFLFLKLAGYGV